MLKRKIDEYLSNWKNDNDKLPLIVKGGRQLTGPMNSSYN